jgi:quercetin dioxygenase-like cupin family protein
MDLIGRPDGSIDLFATPVHLGLGSTARVVEGFAWEPEVLGAYAEAAASDGAEGRLVMAFRNEGSWTVWERHPAGDEVVVCVSGRMTGVQERAGGEHRIALGPGEALVNPAGVWHTADVEEPGVFLTITPGEGTEHRSR